MCVNGREKKVEWGEGERIGKRERGERERERERDYQSVFSFPLVCRRAWAKVHGDQC